MDKESLAPLRNLTRQSDVMHLPRGCCKCRSGIGKVPSQEPLQGQPVHLPVYLEPRLTTQPTLPNVFYPQRRHSSPAAEHGASSDGTGGRRTNKLPAMEPPVNPPTHQEHYTRR